MNIKYQYNRKLSASFHTRIFPCYLFFQRRNSMKISITQVMPLCTQIVLPWWRTKIQRIPSALFCCTIQHDCIPWTYHSRINSILPIQPISSSLENLGQVQLSLVKKTSSIYTENWCGYWRNTHLSAWNFPVIFAIIRTWVLYWFCSLYFEKFQKHCLWIYIFISSMDANTVHLNNADCNEFSSLWVKYNVRKRAYININRGWNNQLELFPIFSL